MIPIIAATITVLCCALTASGVCPAQLQGNRNTEPAVIGYQQNNIDEITDPDARDVIQSYLNNISIPTHNFHLVISCKQIAELRPSYESGYYWIQGASGAVKVYCEMGTNNTFGESGGWMRIANVDMRNNQSQCPPGLVYNVTEGRRLCRKPSLAAGCSSTTFSTQRVEYRQVCGKVIGYQYYQPNGFGPSKYTSPLIDRTYVDGVSITHGSPRQHVWTFADAHDEEITSGHHAEFTSCPCLHPSTSFNGVIPSFVGEDYYCETGSRTNAQRRYYFDDPLWDGEGCEGENECCDRGGPWFCKQLPQPIQDDIETRVCTNSVNSDEDVLLEQIKFFVQ